MIVPCHRKPERCFNMGGQPLPICARCTGILLGYLFIPAMLLITPPLPWAVGMLAQLPMLIDGGTQSLGLRLSNNGVRVVTGLLSGWGLSVIVVAGARGLVELIK
jgi:uncharacterized membrane protein